MNERLLQFIWQFRYLNTNELQFTNGTPFQLLDPGFLNSHQGPDFTDARISFDNQLWIGNIEIHVKSSDWKKHNHHTDANYNNVILLVVWIDDEPAPLDTIPVFCLQERIPKMLLQQYENWMNGPVFFIPCYHRIRSIEAATHISWNRELVEQRLSRKANLIQQELALNHFHWEETAWVLTARNFGLRVNADVFEAVAKSLPLILLAKHKYQLLTLEALLQGQAGLLEKKFTEKYPLMLQKEYRFYKKKYRFQPVHHPVYFLRMRPLNFPTIRLAQLAMFLHTSAGFFSFIRECEELDEVKKKFMVTANDYWHYHFQFDEMSHYQPKLLGAEMIDNLLINIVVPLLFAYGKINRVESFADKALRWLCETNSERNRVTNHFREAGLQVKTAFQSQALLELKQQYCDEKKCLDCMIGKELLDKGG